MVRSERRLAVSLALQLQGRQLGRPLRSWDRNTRVGHCLRPCVPLDWYVMSSSDAVFFGLTALGVGSGLLWEDVWRRYDTVKNCDHDTWDDPNTPPLDGITRRCRKCSWQIQVKDDGSPF